MPINQNKAGLLDSNFILKKIEIKKGQKIAELGCGTSGYFTFPVARTIGNKGKVFAVDIMKNALEAIEKSKKQNNVNNIATVWGDLEIYKGIDIETESIDTALLINTLFQSSKRGNVLREAYRILKKGGKLLVIEWSNIDSPLGPPEENQIEKRNLKAGAKKLGFTPEEEFVAGDYHYGLIFTK